MSKKEDALAQAALATPDADPVTKGKTPPGHDVPAAMNFEQLIEKVKQAEDALEAKERRVVNDWRQIKSTWRAAWTPGRIVITGLTTGFLAGRLDPAKAFAKGGGFMQLMTMVSSLVAGGSAQVAAGQAKDAAESATDAADSATDIAEVVAPDAVPQGASSPAAPTSPRAAAAATAHTAGVDALNRPPRTVVTTPMGADTAREAAAVHAALDSEQAVRLAGAESSRE